MPSIFDLDGAVERAARRLEASSKRRRSDAGTSRLPQPVAERLRSLLLGQERPPFKDLMQAIAAFCRARGFRPPARATVYAFIGTTRAAEYAVKDLPADVRSALYNVDPAGSVPAHQLVFYAFNYGALPAVMFASGLPWLGLFQAARMRGWRPKSRGLFEAVLAVRGI